MFMFNSLLIGAVFVLVGVYILIYKIYTYYFICVYSCTMYKDAYKGEDPLGSLSLGLD